MDLALPRLDIYEYSFPLGLMCGWWNWCIWLGQICSLFTRYCSLALNMLCLITQVQVCMCSLTGSVFTCIPELIQLCFWSPEMRATLNEFAAVAEFLLSPTVVIWTWDLYNQPNWTLISARVLLNLLPEMRATLYEFATVAEFLFPPPWSLYELGTCWTNQIGHWYLLEFC